MATRKSGDGSRGMDDGGGDRPGSYAKTSGARRKRKGKKGRSTNPPPSSLSSSSPPGMESDEPPTDALDVEGEEVEADERGRLTQPEWGDGSADNAVDDLRRKPTSSRAPRRPLGPLGMEEAQLDKPSSSAPPRRLSTPRPPAPNSLNVVEINPGEQTSDNSNDAHYERESADDPFGDPWQHERDASEPPEPALRDAALVSSRADDEEQTSEQSSRHQAGAAIASSHAQGRASVRPSLRPSLQPESLALYRDDDARPSLSSVFGARPSLRPSPPPPAARASSILWWVLVSLLSGIIVAAGVIALREAQGAQKAESASVAASSAARAVQPAERAAEAADVQPAVVAEPSPATSAVVREPLPATPVVNVAGKTPPAAVKAALATQATAPSTPASVTPAALAARPALAPSRLVAAAGATTVAPGAAAEIVVPKAWRPASSKPAHAPKPQAPAVLDPRLPKPTQTAVPAPEPVVTAPPEPAAEPEPADERLPQNPYR